MFNSIFGGLYQNTSTAPSLLQNSQQAQNQLAMSSGMQNSSIYAQQQAQAFNQAMISGLGMYQQQPPPRWMIDGKTFKTSKEFALHIWPDDEQARLMFALKYTDD